MQTKRIDDDVEDGLWRIHNTLYDLTDFIDKHPGGVDWLKWTKGHDITEAFIAHHLAMKKTEPYLKKYRVRETTKPRNVTLTFKENGFYMTLRKKVVAKLPEIQKKTKVYSKVLDLISNFFFWNLWFLRVISESVSVLSRCFVCVNTFNGNFGSTIPKCMDWIISWTFNDLYRFVTIK